MDTRQDAQQNMQHNIFYRHFDLPAHFPVIGLLGDSWQYVREPVSRMHFHNCLEIGYLYKGSGQYYVDDKEVHFEAPAIVLAPPKDVYKRQVPPRPAGAQGGLRRHVRAGAAGAAHRRRAAFQHRDEKHGAARSGPA